MQGFDDTLIISGARWKSVARLLGCIAFIALCLWLLVGDLQSRRVDPTFARIVGAICGVMFSWLALHNLWQAARPPRLVLTKEGFRVIGIRHPVLVRWTDVESFDVARTSNARFAAFKLHPHAPRVRDQRVTQMTTPGFDGLIAVFPLFEPEKLKDILSDWLQRHGTASRTIR